VSFDTVADNARFADKYELPFRLLCDTSREMGVAYGAAADTTAKTPRRISYLIGPDGTVVKAYGKVAPAGHPTEVLTDIAEA
jgi:peroxiredoxin Q/BCP